MIYCVSFSDVLAFLEAAGFIQVGDTEADLIFLHGDGTALTVHRPNQHGDITEAAALAAFDAAEVDPPTFDVHWCD